MNSSVSQNGLGVGQAWFLGAPLTKIVCLSVGLSFVIIELKKAHGSLDVDFEKIINGGEYYRLVAGHVSFSSGGECIMGLGVLGLLMKRFEREMGSRKAFSFVVLVVILAIGLEMAMSQILALNVTYAGPYPWIGAFLWLFHHYTPRIHPRFFGILGFHFSEKAITYAFCFQVVCVGWIDTLFPTVCGGLVAFLWCTSPLQHVMLFPNSVWKVLERIGSRFVDDPPRVFAAPGYGGGGGGGQRGQGGGVGVAAVRAPQPVRPPSPPPEIMIEQLVGMGFEREAVVRALQSSHNNVERAADQLLMGGGG